jgi:hypothetical protein
MRALPPPAFALPSRPEHTPKGDPCTLCDLPASQHRARPDRSSYFAQYRIATKDDSKRRAREHRQDKPENVRAVSRAYAKLHPEERVIVGIDGEGWTDQATGEHHYSYLAACSETRLVGDVYEHTGLSTEQIFAFLTSLPRGTMAVGFSLGYDITKWMQDLPDSTIYALNHPELRKGKWGPRGIQWGAYGLNRISTKFTIERGERRLVVWDLFRFFGKSFVASLKDWEVGSEETRAQIQAMKEQRGNFVCIDEQERLYCQSECKLLATLATTLIKAHEDADIKLRSYYGPGSTASVMLAKMGAKEQIAQVPKDMVRAVECAFFGGRFEHSRVGPVHGVWGYDIASAYPFAITQLPCLAHGRWELKKKPSLREIEASEAACVHYRLPAWGKLKIVGSDPRASAVLGVDGKGAGHAWGPFPFRLEDGNILFPVACAGGWVWKQEYLAAASSFPNVECSEAWLYKTNCACGKPFAEKMAGYYNARLAWGKEGRGIVMKLGVNSCYGKRAQRVGNGPFKCVVSAGIITSTTRAMLLTAMANVRDPWDIVGVATDGIQATCELTLPSPPTTGTEDAAHAKGKQPLGAWECKGKEDLFLIRPGMRFPLDREGKIGSTAARGLGVRTLHENRALVLREWERSPLADVFVQQPYMFMGSKSCVRPNTEARKTLELVKADKLKLGEVADKLANSFTRDEKYGRWLRPEPRKVGYSSLPKRPMMMPGEERGGRLRMATWAISAHVGESLPYGAAELSELAKESKELRLMEEDQADQDGLWTLDHETE